MAGSARSWTRSVRSVLVGGHQYLKSNAPIVAASPLYRGIHRQLYKHAGGVGVGAVLGGIQGAYQGATDGYRDPISGTFLGALGGIGRGAAIGYVGSFGYGMFKGSGKAAKAAGATTIKPSGA